LHDEEGISVVLSTHDLRLVSTVCSWVVLLSRGRVLAEGTPREMLTTPLIAKLYDISPELAAPIVS
jgi:iron complex transport system ATP-binding protein